MRNDYVYIKQAASLCLTTTPLGHDYLARLTDDQIEGVTTPLNELLLFLEQEYIVIPDTSTVDDWLKVICSCYEKQLGRKNPGITKEHIIRAIEEGYVAVKMVIWD